LKSIIPALLIDKMETEAYTYAKGNYDNVKTIYPDGKIPMNELF